MNRNTGRRMRLVMLMILVIAVLITSTGCGVISSLHEREYYSDESNFISGTAVVENIIYHQEDGEIILWLGERDEAYVTGAFILRGENASVAIENGIFEKIAIGDTITFISAPRIFYNGYFFPIVSLSIGDDLILSYEEGYANLMKGKGMLI